MHTTNARYSQVDTLLNSLLTYIDLTIPKARTFTGDTLGVERTNGIQRLETGLLQVRRDLLATVVEQHWPSDGDGWDTGRGGNI